MGKPDHNYVSHKILGKLFRIVDPEPAFKELRQREMERSLHIQLCQVQVPSEILELVAYAKGAYYDLEIWALLLRYRIAQAEAFCGVVLRNANRFTAKDHDLKDPVTDAFRAIVEDIKSDILGRYAADATDLDLQLNVQHWAASCPIGNGLLSLAIRLLT